MAEQWREEFTEILNEKILLTKEDTKEREKDVKAIENKMAENSANEKERFNATQSQIDELKKKHQRDKVHWQMLEQKIKELKKALGDSTGEEKEKLKQVLEKYETELSSIEAVMESDARKIKESMKRKERKRMTETEKQKRNLGSREEIEKEKGFFHKNERLIECFISTSVG